MGFMCATLHSLNPLASGTRCKYADVNIGHLRREVLVTSYKSQMKNVEEWSVRKTSYCSSVESICRPGLEKV